MKKIVLLLLIIPLVAACREGIPIRASLPESQCFGPPYSFSEVHGYTWTGIAYGDSFMVVLPVSKVRENSEFQFVLAPESRSEKDADYEAAWVTISGGKIETDGSITPVGWLDVSGQLSPTVEKLIACVPDLAEGTYKYKVTISDKPLTEADAVIYGYIDPRADIVPD